MAPTLQIFRIGGSFMSIQGIKKSEVYGSQESYDSSRGISVGNESSDDFALSDEYAVEGSDKDLGSLKN